MIDISDIKRHKQRELETVKKEFYENLYKEFHIERLNHKLEHWYLLDWPEFRKELLKAGEKLTYKMQKTWESYFKNRKEKAQGLLNEIPGGWYQ